MLFWYVHCFISLRLSFYLDSHVPNNLEPLGSGIMSHFDSDLIHTLCRERSRFICRWVCRERSMLLSELGNLEDFCCDTVPCWGSAQCHRCSSALCQHSFAAYRSANSVLTLCLWKRWNKETDKWYNLLRLRFALLSTDLTSLQKHHFYIIKH